MDEFKKSISAVLYERAISPLFGTTVITWLLWNWKMWTLLFFVSEHRIPTTKVQYILDNYSDTLHVLWGPLISTFLLLTIVPFASNGAYYLSITFDKWKQDQKNKVEKSRLLTLEQSIQIRSEIALQEERFQMMLERKETEIKNLKAELEILKPIEKNPKQQSKKERLKNELSRKLKEPAFLSNFMELKKRIDSNSQIHPSWYTAEVNYLEFNGLIKSVQDGFYDFTPLGLEIINEIRT